MNSFAMHLLLYKLKSVSHFKHLFESDYEGKMHALLSLHLPFSNTCPGLQLNALIELLISIFEFGKILRLLSF